MSAYWVRVALNTKAVIFIREKRTNSSIEDDTGSNAMEDVDRHWVVRLKATEHQVL